MRHFELTPSKLFYSWGSGKGLEYHKPELTIHSRSDHACGTGSRDLLTFHWQGNADPDETPKGLYGFSISLSSGLISESIVFLGKFARKYKTMFGCPLGDAYRTTPKQILSVLHSLKIERETYCSAGWRYIPRKFAHKGQQFVDAQSAYLAL